MSKFHTYETSSQHQSDNGICEQEEAQENGMCRNHTYAPTLTTERKKSFVRIIVEADVALYLTGLRKRRARIHKLNLQA